jgi:hypothetical protein
MGHNTYAHPDGRQGVGYEIEFSGRPVHSIAWDSGPGDRLTATSLQRQEISVNGNVLSSDSQAEESSTESNSDETEEVANKPLTEAEQIRQLLTVNANLSNADVVATLKAQGVDVTASQVSAARKQLAAK